MAYRLEMAEINAIETLYRSGHSRPKIAELLNINRETVGRYVAELQNQPKAPTGSDDGEMPDSVAFPVEAGSRCLDSFNVSVDEADAVSDGTLETTCRKVRTYCSPQVGLILDTSLGHCLGGFQNPRHLLTCTQMAAYHWS